MSPSFFPELSSGAENTDTLEKVNDLFDLEANREGNTLRNAPLPRRRPYKGRMSLGLCSADTRLVRVRRRAFTVSET